MPSDILLVNNKIPFLPLVTQQGTGSSSKCMELDAQAIHDQVCGKLGSLRRSSVHSLGEYLAFVV